MKRALMLLPLLAVAACDSGPDAAAIEDPVLVRVEGEAIRESDMSAAWDRTFSDTDALFGGEELEQRLLESLVASKVMAIKAEAQLSEGQRRELDARVRAWREEQLVKQYLANTVTPEPVSQAMVEDYYNTHPELFGGGERRQFETLSVRTAGDDALRDRAIALLSKAAEQGDWQALAEANSETGFVVSYRRGVAGDDFADRKLLATLRALSLDSTSALSMADQAVTIHRVTDITTLAPKPLAEVSADIRKRLAPVKLKAAVKQAMDTAMADVAVEYVQPVAQEDE